MKSDVYHSFILLYLIYLSPKAPTNFFNLLSLGLVRVFSGPGLGNDIRFLIQKAGLEALIGIHFKLLKQF